ncbi:hypothetical protein W823_26510 [Williamsia sp. D3]|nr:hypothetical protein W823_26510 [Williamsia sp. D3]
MDDRQHFFFAFMLQTSDAFFLPTADLFASVRTRKS